MDMKDIQVVKNEAALTPAYYEKEASTYLASLGNKLKEEQRTQFIHLCSALGLNPFLREIHAIPFKDNFNIVVGFEVYLKRAERSGKLAGWKVWTEGSGADIKAIIEIKRKDWESPFQHEVYLSEYSTGQAMWAKAPKTMIKKVAMSQGFRLCFPDAVGGLPYTEDEIPTEQSVENLASAAVQEEQPQAKELFKATNFQEEK